MTILHIPRHCLPVIINDLLLGMLDATVQDDSGDSSTANIIVVVETTC